MLGSRGTRSSPTSQPSYRRIARRNNTPYVAVYASVCRGLALSLAGDHVEAIRKLESAIRLAREAFAGLEYESDMLAFLAEIHLKSNGLTAAFGAAEQGIAVARERRARLAECRSTLVLAQMVNADSLRYPQYHLNDLLARARHSSRRPGAALREPVPGRAVAGIVLRTRSVSSRSP